LSTVSDGFIYGTISSFYLVTYDGYGALPLEYDCEFDGADVAQKCDYRVNVNTHQVVLSKSIRTYRSVAKGSFDEDTKWFRQ
jgi:hypothetical protein